MSICSAGCAALAQHAGGVVDQPAAGDVGGPLQQAGRVQLAHRRHVDPGRPQQRIAQRFVQSRRACCPGPARRARGTPCAPASSHSSENPTTPDPAARRPAAMVRPSTAPSRSTTPTAEAGQVVLARLVKPGQLGGLAPQQGAARLPAAVGDARDHLLGDRRRPACPRRSSPGTAAARRPTPPCRSRSWRPDRCPPCRACRLSEGQLQLGAHAVGAGHQHRILVALGQARTGRRSRPGSVNTSGRKVRLTCGLMRSTSSSPASMSTPASR